MLIPSKAEWPLPTQGLVNTICLLLQHWLEYSTKASYFECKLTNFHYFETCSGAFNTIGHSFQDLNVMINKQIMTDSAWQNTWKFLDKDFPDPCSRQPQIRPHRGDLLASNQAFHEGLGLQWVMLVQHLERNGSRIIPYIIHNTATLYKECYKGGWRRPYRRLKCVFHMKKERLKTSMDSNHSKFHSVPNFSPVSFPSNQRMPLSMHE